jgi:hypothetical protein
MRIYQQSALKGDGGDEVVKTIPRKNELLQRRRLRSTAEGPRLVADVR